MKVVRMSRKPGSDLARLWMDEISTREEAECLRGAKLCVLRADLPPLAEDEFYLADLVGLVVRSQRAPSVSLGRVEGVVDNSLQDLLEIDWTAEAGAAGGRARTWLLPAVDAYLREYDDDTLWVDLPEGLLPTALERALEAGSSPVDDVEGAKTHGNLEE